MSSTRIYHVHHIVPRHMGGTDDQSNLVSLSVEEHAEAHKALFDMYGHQEDRLAWLGLAGIATHAESVSEAAKLAGNKTLTMQVGIHSPNWDKGVGGKVSMQTNKKKEIGIHRYLWCNDGTKDTRVHPSKVNIFLKENPSFVRGRLLKPSLGKEGKTQNTIWITHSTTGKRKRIRQEELNGFLSEGYTCGMGSIKWNPNSSLTNHQIKQLPATQASV